MTILEKRRPSATSTGLAAARWRRRAGLAAFAVWLPVSGCTAVFGNGGPPTVIYNTPFGSTPVVPPGPPPGIGVPGPSGPIDRNGVYSGVAVPLDTGGGLCIDNIPINGFRVHGRSVRWRKFRGTIENNGLQMVFGATWVYGQFVGDRFDGQISMEAPSGGPGCGYMLTLQKTAPVGRPAPPPAPSPAAPTVPSTPPR